MPKILYKNLRHSMVESFYLKHGVRNVKPELLVLLEEPCNTPVSPQFKHEYLVALGQYFMQDRQVPEGVQTAFLDLLEAEQKVRDATDQLRREIARD